MQSVVEPGARLFQRGNSWSDAAYAWTQLLFRLTVWSLLGGAIARIAAVQFARRENLTARAAVSYAAARFGSIFCAPLLPLVFIGITAQFPAGLVLYWMTTNLWTVGQGLITRRLVPKTPVGAAQKRSSRTPPAAEGPGDEARSEPPKPKSPPARPQQPRRVKRKKGGSRR